MTFAARIVADSIGPNDVRLSTMEVRFPRIVLSEFNTHRVFSRNSASSRAIPVQQQLDLIKEQPFVPQYWGAAQKGMQAHQELTGERQAEARRAWLAARDAAVAQAERMLELGLHKQLANRILEPFALHVVIVTATEWNNFFALRANPDAQPEIRKIAELMQAAYKASQPRQIATGEWHLPLIQPDEYDGTFEFSEEARRISAARCARVSYLTHDGRRDLNADLKLYERLVSGGHMSPLEHVATPFRPEQSQIRTRMALFAGMIKKELGLTQYEVARMAASLEFDGNFRGWTQLRKTIEGEHDFSLREKN